MSSPHRFVVRRQAWTPPDAAGIRRRLPEKWERVAECRTADDAYAKCATLTADARRTLNPFHLGGPALFYQTSLPAFALHDFLLDADVPPPANSLSSSPTYPFWWVKGSRTFTPEQRDRVWAACDKLTLFDVIEEDDREAAHVVVEETVVPWPEAEMRDWRFSTDGGVIRSAYRTIRQANRVTKELEDEIRGGISPDVYSEDDPLLRFVGTVGVPLSGQNHLGTVHLAVRQSYAEDIGGYRTAWERADEFNAGLRMPLLAFGSSPEASNHLDALNRRARGTVNPFALVWIGRQVNANRLFDERELPFRDLPNGLSFDDAVEAVRKLPTPVPAPPDDTAEVWAAWYDRVVQWSPEYVDVIWGTFADFRLFEAIEVPLG